MLSLNNPNRPLTWSVRDSLTRRIVAWLSLSVIATLVAAATGCSNAPSISLTATPIAINSSALDDGFPVSTSIVPVAATQVGVSGHSSEPTAVPTVDPVLTISPAFATTPTSASQYGTPAATLQPTPPPTVVRSSFSAENALRFVRGLAVDIGSRPSNTSAYRKAAQYIQDQFAAMGYTTKMQPYSFNSFRDLRTELLLKQPELVEISARSFVYTKGGNVEGTVVFCGYGKPTDFPNSRLRGQIALIERGGGLSFEEKVANATKREASGVIVYNDQVGEFRGALATQAAVPVVGILQQDGKRIREYLGKGAVLASLTVEATTETLVGNNILASLNSSSTSKSIVVGAHYDSVAAGPGANDNGSGVGTLLELANVAKGRRYPFNVVFVAFGDEEVGLIGSKKYLEALTQQEKSQILAMVNLDMVGVGGHLEIGGDKDLADRALQIAVRLGINAREMTLKLGTTSDHASFLDARIPAVFVHRVEDPFYHTAKDVIENIDTRYLYEAGQIAYNILEDAIGRY